MQAIKQYTEVINGSIHVCLPENFTAKSMDKIINRLQFRALRSMSYCAATTRMKIATGKRCLPI